MILAPGMGDDIRNQSLVRGSEKKEIKIKNRIITQNVTFFIYYSSINLNKLSFSIFLKYY